MMDNSRQPLRCRARIAGVSKRESVGRVGGESSASVPQTSPGDTVGGPQTALPASAAEHGSVTEWVNLHKAGGDASRQLWQRYVDDVVRACGLRISANQRRTIAAEDMAQEVFHDFFVGIRRGAFPRLENRNDVRQILCMLVERIAIDHARHHRAGKSGGGTVVAFAQLDAAVAGATVGLAVAKPSGPTTEQELRDLLVALVPGLTDVFLQDLVCDRIMGFTIAEIAGRRGISVRSVIRKLQAFIGVLQDRGSSAS